MKSALLTERNKLEILDVPEHSCGTGEIIVRTAVCGVCRTDRKAYLMGQRDLVMPRVLGHEITGVVSEIGGGVSGYRIGDRVVVHPGLFCGECGECLSGLDHLCGKMRIIGFHEDGGFQEYVRIPESGVRRGTALLMPDNVSFSRGAMAEPLACAINMAESLCPREDDRLLVIGAGVLGLLTAKLWRFLGVKDITLADVNEAKTAVAKRIGFTANLLPGEPIDSEGYSAVIVCCPGAGAFGAAAGALKKRGRLGFFSGITGGSPDVKILNVIHYNELRVFGAYGCAIGHTKRALDILSMFDGGIEIEDFLVRAISIGGLRDDLGRLERSEIITQLDFTRSGGPA
jgi:L-iditol 2-dehydrogenase